MKSRLGRFGCFVMFVISQPWFAMAADQWKKVSEFPATEAIQAAAADARFAYAISSQNVAKYDRSTGKRIAVSTGDAEHLNSGFLWRGQLLCAHSNYPQTPERSEIKVLDPQTMKLSTYRNLGDYAGSLVWVVRHQNSWWCNFAKYGDRNHETFLVRFDNDWNELGRWTYPDAVIRHLGRYSLSGGVWFGNDLLTTGHDKRELYRLRLAKTGNVLEFVGRESVPFTGQGIAIDPHTNGLVGISRAEGKVIFVNTTGESPEAIAMPTRGICAHRGASDTHPENTLASFREAIRLGAQMIEFDVALSKDNKLVIMHDATVDRTTDGHGRVNELTLAELKKLDAGGWKHTRFQGETIPTLRETLAIMPTNIWLNVHLKGSAQLAEEVTKEIVAADRLHQVFLACGLAAAKAAQKVDERIQICNMERQANTLDYVNDTIEMDAEFIQLLGGTSVAPAFSKRLREHDVHINFCCANEAERVDALFQAGVEFPLVDRLEAMLKVADRHKIKRLRPVYRSR